MADFLSDLGYKTPELATGIMVFHLPSPALPLSAFTKIAKIVIHCVFRKRFHPFRNEDQISARPREVTKSGKCERAGRVRSVDQRNPAISLGFSQDRDAAAARALTKAID